MNLILVILFVVGYGLIVFESKLKVNKSAFSLLMCGVMWGAYMFLSGHPLQETANEAVTQLGSTCETLMFLIGAMTIVTLIDKHDGFYALTRVVTTHNKVKLLWFIGVATFFISAVLDNMTTTIIMVMLISRILTDRNELCLFSGIIVIAANSGGAWSPIGDVTTIMLWMNGNVTTGPLVEYLLIPSLVSLVFPILCVSKCFRKESGKLPEHDFVKEQDEQIVVSRRFSLFVLILGVAGLLSVPVLKELCNMPPYLSVMLALGVIWIVTDVFYNRFKRIDEKYKYRVSSIIHEIDMSTILFFFGILMAVGVLECSGLLSSFANSLDSVVENVYVIGGVIGVLSSIVDNVPLVAACMGMYPLHTAAEIAASADVGFMMNFVQDGVFWQVISYCAGVGGSLLIIGSAAGVVAMGLQKISFGWYLKKITLFAFIGYIAGLAVLFLEHLLLGAGL